MGYQISFFLSFIHLFKTLTENMSSYYMSDTSNNIFFKKIKIPSLIEETDK